MGHLYMIFVLVFKHIYFVITIAVSLLDVYIM